MGCSGYMEMGVTKTSVDAAAAEGRVEWASASTTLTTTVPTMTWARTLVRRQLLALLVDDGFNNTDDCGAGDDMGVNPRPAVASGCKGGDITGGPKQMLVSSVKHGQDGVT
jgi:hypothetical protein